MMFRSIGLFLEKKGKSNDQAGVVITTTKSLHGRSKKDLGIGEEDDTRQLLPLHGMISFSIQGSLLIHRHRSSSWRGQGPCI